MKETVDSAHTSDADRQVSLLAIDQYLREVRWIAKMTDEEEACLFAVMAQGKAEQQKASPDVQVLAQARRARERVVEGFQRLVIALASRYGRQFPQMDVADLIQEGNLGLLEAIEVHEPLPGRHFVGLASRCIGCAICDALHRRTFLHVTDHMRKWFRRLHRARKRLALTSVDEASVADLAREMAASEEKVREALWCWHACQVDSLQECLPEGQEEDERAVMSVYAGASVQDEAASQRVQDVMMQACEQVLTPRQQTVVGMRFGVGTYDGPCLTYCEAAAELGVTFSAVRQMEMTARKRLVCSLQHECYQLPMNGLSLGARSSEGQWSHETLA